MSNIAVAAKQSNKPVESQPAKTLREVQPKMFPRSALNLALGQDYDRLPIKVPSDWTFEDLMKPVAWTNVVHLVAADRLNTRRDRIGSIIEARADNFYAELLIVGVGIDAMKTPCSLKLVCIGPAQDRSGKAAPRDLRTGLPWVDPVKDAKED